jgi:hypothetical protein
VASPETTSCAPSWNRTQVSPDARKNAHPSMGQVHSLEDVRREACKVCGGRMRVT